MLCRPRKWKDEKIGERARSVVNWSFDGALKRGAKGDASAILGTKERDDDGDGGDVGALVAGTTSVVKARVSAGRLRLHP